MTTMDISKVVIIKLEFNYGWRSPLFDLKLVVNATDYLS